jgi:hypothetical protein
MHNREEQGHLIAQINGSVKRINEKEYVVNSQSNGGIYHVHMSGLGWVCSCPDHKFRGVKCKHVFAVEISFALHKEVEVARIEPLQINCCIFCNSSRPRL